MLRHYLQVAARSLVRHKLYSFINIASLALGLTCAIFILLFIRYETTTDSWVPGSAQLYRVDMTAHLPGRPPIKTAQTSFPVPALMQETIPEVTAATRLLRLPLTLTVGHRQFFETVDSVDPNFLQVVRLPLVSGDPAKVLSQPESLVLSEDTARKLFGDVNPLGQTVGVNRTDCARDDVACRRTPIAMQVTGILRNLPPTSQLVADVLMPNDSVADPYSRFSKQAWLAVNFYGYVTLIPNASPQAVIAKLSPILDRAMAASTRTLPQHIRGSQLFKVHLTPFADVHLDSAGYISNMTPPGSWTTVYGVAAIGVLILLVAAFNFMNLATARATLRAREISLRQCVGATRQQLIVQFLGESVLVALCSLVLALAAVEILLPVYEGFVEHPVAFHLLGDWPFSLLLLGIAIIVGLISGSYPALVLSGLRPAVVLRANTSGQAGSGHLRIILVMLQFAFSIGLGIAAIVVFRQIDFARNIDLGFNRHNIVVLNAEALDSHSRQSLVQVLRTYPGILGAALSNKVPFKDNAPVGLARLPEWSHVVSVTRLMISPEFPSLYDMPLIAGRLLSSGRVQDTLLENNFSPNPANEGHNILINVSAATLFGYTPQQAIGKTIIYNGNHVNIVGVLGDANFSGALGHVTPTVYFNDPRKTTELQIRLSGKDTLRTLTSIDKAWHAFAPDTSSQTYFLSADFEQLYRSAERQGVMFEVLVYIALLIGTLGLFGLAAFTAGRRTKEIGMRRVFGARTQDIALLLLWQFSKPVLIANVIAWPLAWYYLHDWLQGFAYRISLSPLYFFGAGAVALLIAWATVFGHTQRVARANPINALRHE
jgi:putative ABC transport system permease protein